MLALRPTTARLARAGLLSVLSLSLLLPACGKRPEQGVHTEAVAVDMPNAPTMAMAASGGAMSAADAAAEPSQHGEARKRVESDNAGSASVPQKRYVAVRHALQIDAPGAEVANAWTSVRDACARKSLCAPSLERVAATGLKPCIQRYQPPLSRPKSHASTLRTRICRRWLTARQGARA